MTFFPTRRDPDRDHQVVLFTRTHHSAIFVSCNCLAEHGSHRPIGESRDYQDTARLYNDASAHAKPFTLKDRIRIG